MMDNGKANTRQVGGTHYDTGGVQHWDLFGPEYLMGYATKYMRWRKKGGVEDLEKAKHIVQKLREVVGTSPRSAYSFQYLASRDLVLAWARNYGLDWVETTVVMRIMFWEGPRDLDEAVAGLDYLIEGAKSSVKIIAEKLPSVGIPSTGMWSLSALEWDAVLSDRRVVLEPYYRVMGTAGTRVLEPVVYLRGLPRELNGYYSLQPDEGWLVQIDKVPAALRSFFPTLRAELNGKEHGDLPAWQKPLYAQVMSADGKWVVRNKSWTAE